MSEVVILIGIGANLPAYHHGSPKSTCEAAVEALAGEGFTILRRSRWYRSAPVPPSDQPWFVNGVIMAETALNPTGVLEIFHRIEAAFGRTREVRGEARVLDLDLLAMGDRVSDAGDPVSIPHPRMQERAFVIKPLTEIWPDWVHPVSGRTAAWLEARLPADQIAESLD